MQQDDGNRPGFTDAQVREAWNEGARAWETFVESGADYYRTTVHGPALLEVCRPLDGLTVLDLGCGQGDFTRRLARAGARVTGIDLSDALITFAREHEACAPLRVEYRILSAAHVHREWPPGSFDLVTACMSLQDMADAGAALRGAASVLTPCGRMVFSVPHPCTDTAVREWDHDARGRKGALRIDRYFESGPAVFHWNMARLISHWDTPCWRHTLTEWSELIARAGFLVRRLVEPRATAEQARQNPSLDDCHRLPYFLIFDLVQVQRT